MIALPTLGLTSSDENALAALQQRVDTTSGYDAQVVMADTLWAAKNAALFGRVRAALETQCPGARRCCYCEDSMADEIEHVRPKSWFPDQAFVSANYLFSCGPCNSPKGSKYGVVDSAGQLMEAIRKKGAAILPPPVGQEALLHPHHDDPAAFLFIDLVNTFHVLPQSGLNLQALARAKYTRRILRLNNRDALVKGRKEAFRDFAARIRDYYLAVTEGETTQDLARRQQEILAKQHISVWREMQRQATHLPFLQKLFAYVPAAVNW